VCVSVCVCVCVTQGRGEERRVEARVDDPSFRLFVCISDFIIARRVTSSCQVPISRGARHPADVHFPRLLRSFMRFRNKARHYRRPIIFTRRSFSLKDGLVKRKESGRWKGAAVCVGLGVGGGGRGRRAKERKERSDRSLQLIGPATRPRVASADVDRHRGAPQRPLSLSLSFPLQLRGRLPASRGGWAQGDNRRGCA
jgi:hypothetical protein